MKLRIGIEEEFFLIDKTTSQLAYQVPDHVFTVCEQQMSEAKISPELFQTQIEISSKKCRGISELYNVQANNRRLLKTLLEPFKLNIVAVGSYPGAFCKKATISNVPYYLGIKTKFAGVADKLLVNGMHCHVECLPVSRRIKLLNQIRCFLPIFLAFSTSSPFFETEDTGLQSYRHCLMESLPVGGFPQKIVDLQYYDDLLDLYTKIGFIGNPGNIYWHARIGNNLPTIETRIMDSCPRLEDSIAIASLYAAILLTLLEKEGGCLPFYTEDLNYIEFYSWQARRFPINEINFINVSRKQTMAFAEVIDTLFDFIMPIAKKINCVSQLDHLLNILDEGTSADRQRALFKQTGQLNSVHDLLIQETNDL